MVGDLPFLPAGTTLPPAPYLLVVLLATGGVVAALRRRRPRVTGRRVLALAPWMALGSAAHVLYVVDALPPSSHPSPARRPSISRWGRWRARRGRRRRHPPGPGAGGPRGRRHAPPRPPVVAVAVSTGLAGGRAVNDRTRAYDPDRRRRLGRSDATSTRKLRSPAVSAPSPCSRTRSTAFRPRSGRPTSDSANARRSRGSCLRDRRAPVAAGGRRGVAVPAREARGRERRRLALRGGTSGRRPARATSCSASWPPSGSAPRLTTCCCSPWRRNGPEPTDTVSPRRHKTEIANATATPAANMTACTNGPAKTPITRVD